MLKINDRVYATQGKFAGRFGTVIAVFNEGDVAYRNARWNPKAGRQFPQVIVRFDGQEARKGVRYSNGELLWLVSEEVAKAALPVAPVQAPAPAQKEPVAYYKAGNAVDDDQDDDQDDDDDAVDDEDTGIKVYTGANPETADEYRVEASAIMDGAIVTLALPISGTVMLADVDNDLWPAIRTLLVALGYKIKTAAR